MTRLEQRVQRMEAQIARLQVMVKDLAVHVYHGEKDANARLRWLERNMDQKKRD